MELKLPGGFPTRVRVEEESRRGASCRTSHWTLVGDAAVAVRLARLPACPSRPGTLWVPVAEATKRLETLIPWLEAWARIPLRRGSTVVAVGGGVLTDMAGLAAALYMRGIRWHAWPTTLLAQVDAGLGGKTGVDLEAGKNLAGAFHPPAAAGGLPRLPPDPAGPAAGRGPLGDLQDGPDRGRPGLGRNPAGGRPARLRSAAAAPCGPRPAVVRRDPLEAGERRLLNLGHTLGHALEAASGLPPAARGSGGPGHPGRLLPGRGPGAAALPPGLPGPGRGPPGPPGAPGAALGSLPGTPAQGQKERP